MELFENKRKTVMTLRWLLIIALSYLIIFKERGLSLSLEGKSTSLFDLLDHFFLDAGELLPIPFLMGETATLSRIKPILVPLKRAV